MKAKKVIAVAAATVVSACCVGAVASCAPADNRPIITVGYTVYAPMNYEENGVLVGFDSELAQKTFDDLGYRVRMKEIQWTNKYIELESGNIDCIWNGFTANCADPEDGIQRAAKVDFSYSYMTNAQCVIRHINGVEQTTKEGLAGYSVAFEEGSAGASYVAGITGINPRGAETQMDAILQVNAGTANYAVVDLLLGRALAGQGNFNNVVINEGIVIPAEYYAIGFKKNSELTALVNAKLVEYGQSGYLASLAERYGLSTQVITDFSDQM